MIEKYLHKVASPGGLEKKDREKLCRQQAVENHSPH
jgi:hypothetical protein